MRVIWVVLLLACAERGDPPPAATPERARPEAPATETVVDAAPVSDAALPDAAPSADASTRDAASPGDAGADGGGGIKIVAGAAIFEAEPEAAAPPKPKARKPRTRRPRKARKAPKKPPARKPPPPARARRISPMQTIRSHYGDVHHCYSRVALKDPSIAGRITLQWTIGKSGMPQAVAITKDTLKDKSVGRCLKARAKSWKFPAPSGGVQVISYPFDLRVQ